MNKRWIALISSAVMLCGCKSDSTTSLGPQSKAANQRQKLTLALDWFPEPDYLGVFYAQELGLFDKAGVEVEIVEGRGSNLSAAAVRAFCKRFPAKDPVYVKRGWAKVCAMMNSQATIRSTDRSRLAGNY